MFKFYEFMYSKFYNGQRKLYPDSFSAQFTAMLGIATVQYLSLLCIILLSDEIFKTKIILILATPISNIIMVLVAIILAILNYKIYIGDKKLLHIKNKYKNITKQKKMILSLLVWANIILIILIFISALFFIDPNSY